MPTLTAIAQGGLVKHTRNTADEATIIDLRSPSPEQIPVQKTSSARPLALSPDALPLPHSTRRSPYNSSCLDPPPSPIKLGPS